MYAGQKASYQGYQYCLFPMDYIDCNQLSGPDSATHCCGHPCDWGGPSDHYPYYAPCDCTRIWTYSASGESIWTSDNKVWTPSGLQYVSFMFTHDDNMTSRTHCSQGDLIGHTGTAGFAWGDHLHLDQSLVRNDQIMRYGYQCPGGNDCWALRNSAYVYDVFYLGGTEQIVDLMGMSFQTIPGVEPEPPLPDPPGPVTPVGNLSAGTFLLLCKYKLRRQKNGKRIIRL